MPPIPFAVVVVLVALLVLQGITLLVKNEGKAWHLWAGALTLTLAAMLALGAWLLGNHVVVIAPDLDAALVEGRRANAVRAWIVLYVMAGWLLVRSAGAAHDVKGYGFKALPLLLVVMLLGLRALQPLERVDAWDSTILQIDLHSPPLLLWGTLCVLQWILLVLGVENGWLRSWLSMLLGVGLSAACVLPGWPHAVSSTRNEWEICIAAGVTLLPAVGLRTLVWKRWSAALSRHRLLRWSLRFLWFALAAATLVAYAFVDALPSLPAYGVPIAIAALVVVLFIILFRLRGVLTRECSAATGRRGKAARLLWAMLAAFILVLLACLDTIYLRWLPDPWNVAVMALAVVVFIELAGEGPLIDGSLSVGSAVVGDHSFARVGVRASVRTLRGMAGLVARPVAWIWSLRSVSGAVVKLFAATAVLVLLWELPNRNKTVVRPLDVSGLPKSDEGFGKQIAQRIAHEIGELASELKASEVILPRDKSARNKVTLGVATESDVALRAAVQNDAIEIGSLKIPLALLLDPVQRSLEIFFGVRTVRGSVQKVADRYELLVTASTGEIWPVRRADATKPEELKAMAERAAFDIVSSDPSWKRGGMSNDWEALQAYRRALECLRAHGRQALSPDDVVARMDAIQRLRTAIEKDPTFALAQYQLGIALQLDGEPAAAAEALRAASAANPDFLSANNALARLLMDYSGQLPSAPTADAPAARRFEAARLWQAVVDRDAAQTREYDRAAAYHGLCDLTLRAVSAGRAGFHRAFYYCAVADRLYSRLSAETLPAADLLRGRASSENNIGVILVRVARMRDGEHRDVLPWHCDGATARVREGAVEYEIVRGRHPHRRAAALFERAHDLDREDPVIACNVASEKDPRARDEALEALQERPQMQFKVADELMEKAKGMIEAREVEQAALLYRAATDAVQRVIDLEPENLDALNSFAYMYREWREAERRIGAKPRVDVDIADRAERYARKAARLAPRKQGAFEAMVLSTLGEVLLERGRPHEAIEPLSKALGKLQDRGNHPTWDELRRDLAQAYLCAEQEDRAYAKAMHQAHPRCTGLGKKADELLAKIRENEGPREARHYVVEDYEQFRASCVLRPEGADDVVAGDVRVTYRGSDCRKSLVTLTLAGSTGCARIWGRDFERWSALDGSDPSFTFAVPERPTHAQYFVQVFEGGEQCGLVENELRPLSPRYAFDTDFRRCRVTAEFVDQRVATTSTGGK